MNGMDFQCAWCTKRTCDGYGPKASSLKNQSLASRKLARPKHSTDTGRKNPGIQFQKWSKMFYRSISWRHRYPCISRYTRVFILISRCEANLSRRECEGDVKNERRTLASRHYLLLVNRDTRHFEMHHTQTQFWSQTSWASHEHIETRRRCVLLSTVRLVSRYWQLNQVSCEATKRRVNLPVLKTSVCFALPLSLKQSEIRGVHWTNLYAYGWEIWKLLLLWCVLLFRSSPNFHILHRTPCLSISEVFQSSANWRVCRVLLSPLFFTAAL